MNKKLALILLLVSSLTHGQQPQAPSTFTCPVTPFDEPGGFGNDAIKTIGWPNGRIIFEPGGPGFIEEDGSLGMKWPWIRLIEGMVTVGGIRLDDQAPMARAYFSDGYGNIGFQPSYLVFPTPGCWQIKGSVSGQSITFVVLVEKIGAGPDWKSNGPEPGLRVTSDEIEI